MKKLENKNIIVTAAGQGIGRATAIAYSKEGANVTATDINEKTLKSLKNEFPDIKAVSYTHLTLPTKRIV